MFAEKIRVNFFVYIALFILAVMGMRLLWLQVYQYDFYAKRSRIQSNDNMTIMKFRGTIEDRNGRMLAGNRKVASLYTYGHKVEDPQKFVIDLAAQGVEPVDGFESRIQRKRGFVWIQRNVPISMAKKIQERFDFVEYAVEESRYYPEGSLLGDVLGFTGTDNQGLAGLEYFLNDYLKGVQQSIGVLRDSRGEHIILADHLEVTAPVSKVTLSVDANVQAMAEQILLADATEYGAQKGVALAMDAKTGEIVFAATTDNYDPNNYKAYSSYVRKNDISNYLYEPGSTFKAVTFSYLMERGKYEPDRMIDCEMGKYAYHNTVINDVKKLGMIPERQVFTYSSNIGTWKLAMGLEDAKFYEYLKASGFGDKPNAFGMSEEDGLLRPVKQWSKLSKGSISFGQEVMVTPIQLVRFYAAIVNNGIIMDPLLVRSIDIGGKKAVIKQHPRQIMSAETAAKMRDLMRETVLEGTGSEAKSDVVSIGGKTGTAQKFDHSQKKYSSSEYIASFAGFFPVEQPRYAMLVLYDSPQTSIYGGSTAAKTFRKLAEQMMLQSATDKIQKQVAYDTRRTP